MRICLPLPMGSRVWALLLALELGFWLGPFPAPALSRLVPLPARGMFLVADEQIRDPRFQETVILLVRHDREGAVGLIVNRPTRIALAHALPGVEELAGRPETVSFGGPVALRTMLVLLQSAQPPDPSAPVLGDLHVTGIGGLTDRLARKEDAGERFRVFMGFAGWGPGQLEAEIARGDWHLVPADAGAVFDREPATLWPELRGNGIQVWI